MSKAFGPAFNVHTFSATPYLASDVSYVPGAPNAQFSWSIAGPSSAQATAPSTPQAGNGVPTSLPTVLPREKPSKNKQRSQEEADITRRTSERFAMRLAQDQANALQPDVDSPFSSYTDAVQRLLPYHIYQQPREDLESLRHWKGKQRATGASLGEEVQETRFALECYKRYHRLRERFRKAKTRTASRPVPDDQAYVLAQAILEADRTDASLLSNELKVARGELERLEREKRAANVNVARTQYGSAAAVSAIQTHYYRPYPYAYTQAYGAPIPPTTSTFQVAPPPPAGHQRPTSAIPVQLPVASLPALHALGIHPVPAASVSEGQTPPPAVLRGSTANGTMLTLEINVSLLQSAQMSGLAMVLNSLMSRTSPGTASAGPGSPSIMVGGSPGSVPAASTGGSAVSPGSTGGETQKPPPASSTTISPSVP